MLLTFPLVLFLLCLIGFGLFCFHFHSFLCIFLFLFYFFCDFLVIQKCVFQYWSFSVSISPSNEHPGLISFRTDWLDLLTVQGTHKNLLQHHSSKASILQHSTFFTVQLSHPFTTTGKTIAMTRWTFVGKVMSLLVELGYLFDFFLVS